MDFPSPQKWFVFPTGVGMNLRDKPGELIEKRVPHRRGDEPVVFISPAAITLCSPQAWG